MSVFFFNSYMSAFEDFHFPLAQIQCCWCREFMQVLMERVANRTRPGEPSIFPCGERWQPAQGTVIHKCGAKLEFVALLGGEFATIIASHDTP
ncbi:MAG: hypothetical protein ABI977_16565 [Acidobacteriota bacterium]